jgi:hypothetical protein
MASKRNLPRERPQDRQKHPEPWQSALNPERGAARSAGTRGALEPAARPASEIKRVVRSLDDFSRDELERVLVIEPGARLRPRAVYVDLRDPKRKPFRAPDDAIAGKDSLYVAKAAVARHFWNRLIRVPEPERDRGIVTRADEGSGGSVRRAPAQRRQGSARSTQRVPDGAGLPRSRGDETTRMLRQGDNELRGGRERSERRGAGTVRKAPGPARHPSVRSH